MTILVSFSLILIIIGSTSCGFLENSKQSSSQAPSSPTNPDNSQLPATPGYALSSASGTLTSTSYKLRFRYGKVESIEKLSGSNYNIRTGKIRHLKDM